MGRVELPESPTELLENAECPPDEILTTVIERGAAAMMEDVPTALEWADVGVELACRFSTIRRAQMLSFRGAALRAVGRYKESEDHFNEALWVLGNESPATQADVFRRFAGLRACQKRLDEAFWLANQAVDLSKKHGSEHQLGKAMAAVAGVCYLKEEYDNAVQYFANSQRHLEYNASPSSYYAVSHNLAVALVKAPNVKRFGSVFAALKAARRTLPPRAKVARAKLKWIEGLAYLRLGNNNRAVEILSRLFKRFEGTLEERATLAVDLAKAYFELPNLAETCATLEQALELYRSIEGVNTDFVASMAECLDGLKKRTGEYDPWDVRDVVAGEQLAA